MLVVSAGIAWRVLAPPGRCEADTFSHQLLLVHIHTPCMHAM
jgi:hypothetical protein